MTTIKRIKAEGTIPWVHTRAMVGLLASTFCAVMLIINAWGHNKFGLVFAALGIACSLAGTYVQTCMEGGRLDAAENAIGALAMEAVKWQARAVDIKQAVEAAGVTKEVMAHMETVDQELSQPVVGRA